MDVQCLVYTTSSCCRCYGGNVAVRGAGGSPDNASRHSKLRADLHLNGKRIDRLSAPLLSLAHRGPHARAWRLYVTLTDCVWIAESNQYTWDSRWSIPSGFPSYICWASYFLHIIFCCPENYKIFNLTIVTPLFFLLPCPYCVSWCSII